VTASRAAGVGAVLLFGGAVTGWILAAVSDSPPYATASDLTWAMSFLAFPIVGLLLAVRQRSNPIGWMFILGPGLVGHGVAQMEAGREALGDNHFGPGLLVLLASVLLFPDGRYPGRPWMWAHAAVLGGIVIEPIISPETDGGRSVAAAFLLTIGSLVYRVIRGDGVTRRQLALPVLVGVVGAVGATVSGLLTDSDWAGVIWMSVMTAGVPVAIAVAIFRYRLYEIDRIVSRTVAYALVAVVIVCVYALPVVTLPRLLGESNDLVIAGSTLAAAAVFDPVRRRIQRAVDHRFNRARYDAEREVELLTAELRSTVTVDAVAGTLTGVITRTVQPGQVALWIREGL
jgi:hypothetical protein